MMYYLLQLNVYKGPWSVLMDICATGAHYFQQVILNFAGVHSIFPEPQARGQGDSFSWAATVARGYLTGSRSVKTTFQSDGDGPSACR